MIIKLKGADFSANNINSLLNSWPITFYGRTLVTGTFVSSVSKGSTYTATFSVADQCTVDSVVITRGGATISGATISGSTISISVPTTTESGPISITFNGSKENGDYITVPLSSFMDLVGTNSGSINFSTGEPSLNASENWRHAKISLAEYDIKQLTLVTGLERNGVAPVMFTSSETLTGENVVAVLYGKEHQYITNEYMLLFTGEITIPDGATHMVINELLKYDVASTTNAEALKALCSITYRVND